MYVHVYGANIYIYIFLLCLSMVRVMGHGV